MNDQQIEPAVDAGEHPDFVGLFDLELTHRFKMSIKPAIKAELDHKQKIFDTSLRFTDKPVQSFARPRGRNRCRRRRAERERTKAKPVFVRDLAARLSRHWRAPLVFDHRLKPAG